MAEQSPHPEATKKVSGGQALVQIGHYVLGETLGIGTFGKVKGKSKKAENQKNLNNIYHFSWISPNHKS